jgi:hypothetical protein
MFEIYLFLSLPSDFIKLVFKQKVIKRNFSIGSGHILS